MYNIYRLRSFSIESRTFIDSVAIGISTVWRLSVSNLKAIFDWSENRIKA